MFVIPVCCNLKPKSIDIVFISRYGFFFFRFPECNYRQLLTHSLRSRGESGEEKVLNKNKCGPVVKIIDQKKKTCVENQK
jgi:hypothetical protein